MTENEILSFYLTPSPSGDILAAFGPIRDHFHPKQHQLTAARYRKQMHQRIQDWQEIVGLKPAT